MLLATVTSICGVDWNNSSCATRDSRADNLLETSSVRLFTVRMKLIILCKVSDMKNANNAVNTSKDSIS